ncbi:hypothetical protein KEJ36_03645, partial [Candidatus Bathyarchaeota archaeon]|nr:hypothetical protein [Candidatus Bathyarchaeota archaeon]
MNKRLALGISLVTLGLLGILTLTLTLTSTPFNPEGGYKVEYRPMMGPWMMGWPENPPSETSITLDQVKHIAEQYLDSPGVQGLAIKEVMEFEQNYYIVFYEKETGIGAFEALIWKTGPSAGRITPEPGPNMMWNTKYGWRMGHMSGIMNGRFRTNPSNYMPIDEDE